MSHQDCCSYKGAQRGGGHEGSMQRVCVKEVH